MGFKLCWLKTHVWFEDEKRTKHHVLSPFMISNKQSLCSEWSFGAEMKADSLYMFFHRLWLYIYTYIV